jgi:predicted nuclease with TOPRIM domain
VTLDFYNCICHRKDLFSRFEDLHYRFEDLHGHFEDLHGRFEDLHGRFEDLHGRFEYLLGRVEDLLSRAEDILSRFEDLLSRVEDLHCHFEDLHGRFEDLFDHERVCLKVETFLKASETMVLGIRRLDSWTPTGFQALNSGCPRSLFKMQSEVQRQSACSWSNG